LGRNFYEKEKELRLFLDCEFNGFKGELISMSLVSEMGHEWYEVLPCENPIPWVKKHVIPVLEKKPVEDMSNFQWRLYEFLKQFDSIHVVADWPEDIAHFCTSLLTIPGERLNTPPLTLEVLRVDSVSEVPHNALSDARCIRNFVLCNERLEAEKTRIRLLGDKFRW